MIKGYLSERMEVRPAFTYDAVHDKLLYIKPGHIQQVTDFLIGKLRMTPLKVCELIENYYKGKPNE